MKAQIVKKISSPKTPLWKVLPLDTPYCVEIFPVNACIYHCQYCGHFQRPDHIRTQYLDFALFKKFVDESKAGFKNKFRVLVISGYGEPLLHPDLPRMVEYAKIGEISDKILLITNGQLLTEEKSKSLIAAGLDALKISMQGITDEQYKKMAGKNASLDTVLNNIRYFYENKVDTNVNVKIIHEMLQGAEMQVFYDLVGDIADTISIEYLVHAENAHTTGFMSDNLTDVVKNRFDGNPVEQEVICPAPFYWQHLFFDGEVALTRVPTFEEYKQISIGNVKDSNFAELWTSAAAHKFRLNHLKGNLSQYPVCKKCTSPRAITDEEDWLMPYREQLIELFESELRIAEAKL